MTGLPVRLSLPTLRIDGVGRELSALAVLRRDERLPGGLRWSLEFDQAAVTQHLAHAPPLRTGQPSQLLEKQLFSMLRQILRRSTRPQYCIASIDSVEAQEYCIRLSGRCAPLLGEPLYPGGLMRSCC